MSPGRIALVVALLLLVNLPVLGSIRTDRQIANDGEEVTAEVLDTREQGGEYAVVLRFTDDVDPTGSVWLRRVTESTYEQARVAGELPARAVAGEPGAFEVADEVRSSTGIWMTLLGNVLVAGWVALMVRRRRRLAADPDPGDDPDPDLR